MIGHGDRATDSHRQSVGWAFGIHQENIVRSLDVLE